MQEIIDTNDNVQLQEIQVLSSQMLNNTDQAHVQVPNPKEISVVPLPQSSSKTQTSIVRKKVINTIKKRTLEDINKNDSSIVINPYALMNKIHDKSMIPKRRASENLFNGESSNLAHPNLDIINLTDDEDHNILETREHNYARQCSYLESSDEKSNTGQNCSLAFPSISKEVFVNDQEAIDSPENLTEHTEDASQSEGDKVSQSQREDFPPQHEQIPQSIQKSPQIKQYLCSNCDKVFRNLRTLKSHLENDCGRIYMCNGCRKTYPYNASYCRHKKKCRLLKWHMERMRQQDILEKIRENERRVKVRPTPRYNIHSEDEDVDIID